MMKMVGVFEKARFNSRLSGFTTDGMIKPTDGTFTTGAFQQ